MAISTEQIHQAADRLAAKGVRPTLAAVRRELAGGSYTTISEAMKEWRQENTTAEEGLSTASERFQQLTRQAIGRLWAEAQQEAAASLEAEQAALSRLRKELEEQQRDVVTLADQLTERVERLEAELAEEKERSRTLAQQEQALQTKNETLEERHKTFEAECARLTLQLEKSGERERQASDAAAELRGLLMGREGEIEKLTGLLAEAQRLCSGGGGDRR